MGGKMKQEVSTMQQYQKERKLQVENGCIFAPQ